MAKEGKADKLLISSPNWTLKHSNHHTLLPDISGRVYVSNGKFKCRHIILHFPTLALNNVLAVKMHDLLQWFSHCALRNPWRQGERGGRIRRGPTSPKSILLQFIFIMRMESSMKARISVFFTDIFNKNFWMYKWKDGWIVCLRHLGTVLVGFHSHPLKQVQWSSSFYRWGTQAMWFQSLNSIKYCTTLYSLPRGPAAFSHLLHISISQH